MGGVSLGTLLLVLGSAPQEPPLRVGDEIRMVVYEDLTSSGGRNSWSIRAAEVVTLPGENTCLVVRPSSGVAIGSAGPRFLKIVDGLSFRVKGTHGWRRVEGRELRAAAIHCIGGSWERVSRG